MIIFEVVIFILCVLATALIIMQIWKRTEDLRQEVRQELREDFHPTFTVDMDNEEFLANHDNVKKED